LRERPQNEEKAVYHATGVRVRDLPVRIEDLLTAQV
jgi:xanthine dehydrogenase YagR molybdenum-binding subunit